MKTPTTLLAGLALAALALASPTASADPDIHTPFGDPDPCGQDAIGCRPIVGGGLHVGGGNSTDDCNGLYDDSCTCQQSAFACPPGTDCSEYVYGLCVVG